MTNRKKLKADEKIRMSRTAKCIDNDPMEGFWGILKRERYYGRQTSENSRTKSPDIF